MALKIKCDSCDEEIQIPGALLFSPPKEKTVKKIHLCKKCYYKTIEILNLKEKLKEGSET